jgi:hypothetical protein
MAGTSGTEVGAKWGDEGYTGLGNIGHGFVWVTDGIITGRLIYPGVGSGGLSSQEGDCAPILEGREWLAGHGAPVDDGTHKPLATTDTDGKIAAAGWMRQFDQWTKPNGQVATAPAWSWVGTDGEIGTPPGGGDVKVAARKALADALDTAQAAAAILAAGK